MFMQEIFMFLSLFGGVANVWNPQQELFIALISVNLKAKINNFLIYSNDCSQQS